MQPNVRASMWDVGMPRFGPQHRRKQTTQKLSGGRKVHPAYQLQWDLPLQTGCLCLRHLHVCPAFRGVIAVHFSL